MMMTNMMRIRETHLSRVTVLIPNVLVAIVQKLDAQQVRLMMMMVLVVMMVVVVVVEDKPPQLITATSNLHNISAPHIITTTNHLMEQDMTGWHIDHNCTVPFVLRLVN